tara:strand:+ start:479 stop:1702 length:1224 start_codon:yes stop_codon:yes gene_type:complete
MEINTKEYFEESLIDKTKSLKYKLNVCSTSKDIGIMINYFLKFIKNKKIKNRTISMDFEFNNCNFKKGNDYNECIKNSVASKEIAIFQILLEDDEIKLDNEVTNIFLFYPPDLSKSQNKVLIDLLTEPGITKIIHGGESLDIPYLFNILIKDQSSIIKFCENLYDTKFICEYSHLKKNTKDKCKIYYFLKEMNVINEQQFNNLLKNEEEMGPIWFINLDIKKLNKNVILYSSFDVLYLKDLLRKFKKSSYELKIISGITSICYLYRTAIPETSKFLDKISEFNVHMLFDNNHGSVKFLDVFDLYYYWYDDDNKIFSKLTEINFFKRFIQTLVKIYLYEKFTDNNINSKYGVFTSSLKEQDKKLIKEINKNFYDFHIKIEGYDFQPILSFLEYINTSIRRDFIDPDSL